MTTKRRFFSGSTLDAALVAAGSEFGLAPEEVAYDVVEKRHGFVRTRRNVVIKVDPEAPRKAAKTPAAKAPAAKPKAAAEDKSAAKDRSAPEEIGAAEGKGAGAGPRSRGPRRETAGRPPTPAGEAPAAQPPRFSLRERSRPVVVDPREEERKRQAEEHRRRSRRDREADDAPGLDAEGAVDGAAAGTVEDRGAVGPEVAEKSASARRGDGADDGADAGLDEGLGEGLGEGLDFAEGRDDADGADGADAADAVGDAESPDDSDSDDDADSDDGSDTDDRRRGRGRGGRGRDSRGPGRAGGGASEGRATDEDQFDDGDDADEIDDGDDGDDGDGDEAAPLPPLSERYPKASGPLAEAAEEATDWLLDFLDVDVDALFYQGDDRIEIDLRGPDREILVAENGEVLAALEHLIPRVMRGVGGTSCACRVDSEGFQDEREERLRRLATRASRRVKRDGRAEILEPMDPADRRIVHLTLADDEEVSTHSLGSGFMKRVKVSPR